MVKIEKIYGKDGKKDMVEIEKRYGNDEKRYGKEEKRYDNDGKKMWKKIW